MFIKDITYTARSALYIDLNIVMDSNGRVIGRNATTKDMISIYQFWTLYFWVATFQKTKEKQWPQYWSRHSTDHTGLIQYISIIMKICSSENSCLSIFVVSHSKYSSFHCLHLFILFHLLASDVTILGCCFLDQFHNFCVIV